MAALRGFKRRLPDLVDIPQERVSHKYVLFGAVAEVQADVIGGDHICLKTILTGLLDEKAAVLTANDVVPNYRIVELLENHPVAAIVRRDITFDQRVTAEHESRANRVMGQGVC